MSGDTTNCPHWLSFRSAPTQLASWRLVSEKRVYEKPAAREMRQVQIQARVGQAVGLADQPCRGATGTFAPGIVVGDDLLGTHEDFDRLPNRG